jgi:uncharacterized membrane protein (DUF106 family)
MEIILAVVVGYILRMFTSESKPKEQAKETIKKLQKKYKQVTNRSWADTQEPETMQDKQKRLVKSLLRQSNTK